jgi:hypothetical protein
MNNDRKYLQLASATWLVSSLMCAGAWVAGSSHWALVAALNALSAALGFYAAADAKRSNVPLRGRDGCTGPAEA